MAGIQLHQSVDDALAIPHIPAAAQSTKVVDRSYVVIAQKDRGARRRSGDGAFQRKGQMIAPTLYAALARSHIQIAPLDGDVIAGMPQYLLLFLTGIGDVQAIAIVAAAAHCRRHFALVAQPIGSEKIQKYLMRLSVRAAQRQIHIGNGRRQHIQIVRKRGSPEANIQLNAGGKQRAACLRGRYLDRQGFCGGI